LEDVPTDADYAMELISQRVAAGLDVKPRPKKERKKRSGRAITIDEGDSNFKQGNRNNEKHREKDNNFDWKKWGERAALVQVWADDGKRLLSGRQVCTRVLMDRVMLKLSFSVARMAFGLRTIPMCLSLQHMSKLIVGPSFTRILL
jgi:hypothetical protein